MISLFRPVVAVESASSAIAKVLASGYTGEGARCEEFERALSTVLGYQVLLVNSGTSALKLAFLGSGVAGAEVITTPVTCIATPAAAVDAGASLVWADIDPETGNIDPEDVARKASSRTAAICPVDWAGRLCDFDRIRSLVRGVSIVEDAAHAFVADRIPTDSKGMFRGDWICHSFQSIKHLSMADGGAVAAPGEAALHDAREDRWFGLDRTRNDSMRCHQRVKRLGYKLQSNDVLAAIGLSNLPKAIEAVRRCRVVAERYSAAISGMRFVRAPRFDLGASYWMFPIKVSNPAKFEIWMQGQCIQVSQVHSRCDVQPCFNGARYAFELPGVDEFMAHSSNLPTMPHLTDDDVTAVINALERWDTRPEAKWNA